MAGYPTPTKYRPRNISKYKGDPTNITSRSSWEHACMVWFDKNPNCIEWSSESTIVNYFSPVDEKMHRYFVDFTATFRYKDNSVQKFLIEVKPASQTVKPVKGNKREKTFLNEALTWTVNEAKWKAAEEYAASKGMKFIKITEHELFGKKSK